MIAPVNKPISTSITVRFAGDSGDGMQLLGSVWVKSCALNQNDLSTMPDFPAEIRAPAGTLAGVSSFQIQFASVPVFTAGDRPQVLVALNPAALKANIRDVEKGGMIIINSASFNDSSLTKAGYQNNPLQDGSLSEYQVLAIDMNGILRKALEDISISSREVQKCKNFFCLGLLYWLYTRKPEQAFETFAGEANLRAFKSGYAYGENTEAIARFQEVKEAPLKKGKYRVITGNKALSLGLLAASANAKLSLFFASYPITPASDILHELAALRAFDVSTFQAEDEIAAIGAAIGASYAGAIGVTATSGPGFALKAESLGYAVMLELPLIVIDVQRAGPSTGMPTKTEQADLLQAIFGRSGEAPIPVLAAASPAHCFDMAIEAMRIAVEFMTPVVLLSDASIASCSAPWLIPELDNIIPIVPKHAPHKLPYESYARCEKTLSRAWVLPGTEGLMHQLGGLEKDSQSGKVSYDADNHQKMVKLRAEKIDKIKGFVAAPTIFGPPCGDVLLIGFGGSFGALRQACIDLNSKGLKVAHLHLSLLNPLHDEIAKILGAFKHIIIAEHNLGQLNMLIRAKFLVNASSLNKIKGKPFLVEEVTAHVEQIIASKESSHEL